MPSMKSEYITLINSFWNSAMMNPLSKVQVSLYFALLHICNRSYWTEWFQAPNQVLSVLTGLSRSGILKARNELKQRGLIDFKERGTKATVYKLSTLSVIMSNSTQDGVQDSKQDQNTIANSKQDSVQNSTQKGVQNSKQDSVQNSSTKERYKRQDKKNISNEISEEKKSPPDFPKPEEIPQEVLECYIANLNASGKMMTGAGLELLFKRLEQLAPGNTAEKIAILEQSIRKNWKDIYPLQKDNPKKNDQETKETPNRFHNFEQRNTDYDAMVLDRLKQRLAAGDSGNQPITGDEGRCQ